MKIPAIPLKGLLEVHDALEHVKYDLGAKAPSMKTRPTAIEYIDCSGYVVYGLYVAFEGEVKIIDGSVRQRSWCEKNLKEVPYSTVATAGPDRLFIAFHTPYTNGCGKTGHVWLINAQLTLESYGGHGVGRRAWNDPALLPKVHKCFEIPTKATEPPKLVLDGKLLTTSYLTPGTWNANEGDVAVVVGAHTQYPNRPAAIRPLLASWGFEIEKYTDEIKTKNRAYIRTKRAE